MFRSTRGVAALLGVRPSRISKAIWEGRLRAPERGPSGNFLWTETDLRRACWFLLRRDLDTLLAERRGGGDHE